MDIERKLKRFNIVSYVNTYMYIYTIYLYYYIYICMICMINICMHTHAYLRSHYRSTPQAS